MPTTFEALADLIETPTEKDTRSRALSLRISPALDFSIRFMANRLQIPHTRLAAMLLDTAAEQFGPICKARVEAVPGNLMIDPSPSKIKNDIGDGLEENTTFGTWTKAQHDAHLDDMMHAQIERAEQEDSK